MRTMNKIVALSLVLAMALSMMASAASFKDQATINADLVSDINMMVALNVFSADGTGAGYFEPNVELTRAQVAKMVYVLKNKGVDNGATSWTGMNIFNDVEAGAWYEGYVNYCASVGMIAGVGNNNFNPNGKVTAVEFAKLLLVLNGYKADVEGYTGDKWFENIVADAENAGIFANYELPVKGTVTREWAAKLLNNAINVTKVRYEDGEAMEMYSGYPVANVPVTFMAQDLGIEKTKAVLTETIDISLDATPANNPNGTNKVAKLANGKYFAYDVADELLGQEVLVLSKGVLATTSAGATEVKVYGVSATGASKVYTTLAADIKEATDNLSATIDGHKFVFADATTYTYYENYVPVAAASDVDFADLYVQNGLSQYKIVDVYGDGKTISVFATNPIYAIVNTYKADNNQFKLEATPITTGASLTDYQAAQAGGTSDAAKTAFEKFVFNGEVKKGDVVSLLKDYSTGKEKIEVTVIDPIYANVTKITSSNVITVGNFELKRAAGVTFGGTFDAFPTRTTTDSANYYAVGNYLIHSKDAEGSNVAPTNIALVLDAKNGTKSTTFDSTKAPKLQVLTQDGTTAIYEYATKDEVPTGWLYVDTDDLSVNNANDFVVKGDDTTKVTLNKALIVYEYKFIGEKIVIRNLESNTNFTSNGALSANVAFAYETDTISINSNTFRADENAIFFLYSRVGTSDKWTVVKASEMPMNISAGDSTQAVHYGVTTASGKLPVFNFAVIKLASGTEAVGTAAVPYAYVSDAFEALNAENKVEVYVSLIKAPGAEAENVLFNGDLATATTYKAEFVKVTTNTSGKVSLDEVQLDADQGFTVGANLVAFEGKEVKIGSNFYTIADDAQVWNVKDGKLVAGSDLKVGTANVAYKLKGVSGTDATIITDIIVEMDGTALLDNNGLVD